METDDLLPDFLANSLQITRQSWKNAGMYLPTSSLCVGGFSNVGGIWKVAGAAGIRASEILRMSPAIQYALYVPLPVVPTAHEQLPEK